MRPVLENPSPKNCTFYIILGVKVNSEDSENPDNPYSSEAISELLDDALKCEVCGGWHLNQSVCGMDEVWLDDFEEGESK